MSGIDKDKFDFDKLTATARLKIEAEEGKGAHKAADTKDGLIHTVALKKAEALKAVSDAHSLASEQLAEQGREIERKITQLKVSRVAGELVWNNLPQKIAIGIAVLVGLAVGVGAMIVAAQNKRSSLEAEIARLEAKTGVMQAAIATWEETAGFDIIQHRGQVAIRLQPEAKFKRYAPVVGVIGAGNLWRVHE